ncbi:MAG: hypothetical protein ACREOM_13490, partial [Candidatus Dormibacteraceae bacterium]
TVWMAPAVLAINVVVFLMSGVAYGVRFWTEVPLGLPGAESIRVPQDQAVQLRGLVAAIDRQCSTFVTLPGMDSFYLWTAQEPPTSLRVGPWWLNFVAGIDPSTLRDLEGRPRLCAVKSRAIVDYWLQGRPLPQDPLISFIDLGFVDSGTYGACELLVRT